VEAARSALIAGIAICGLAAVVLSFLPWVTFENRIPSAFVPEVSASFSGADLSPSRDIESITQAEAPHAEGWCSCDVAIGDGYFTAALGLLLIASAGVARFGGRFALGGTAAAAAAIVIVVLAGYNAVTDWNAIVHAANFPVTTDGAVQPALYVLVVVAAIAAIDGSAAWAITRAAEPTDEEAYDYDEDEETMEGTEAWA
jgi:hypothetical protein